MFSEVMRLIKIFYIIPVTTATAERSFSALRRLKTYLRSTMSQERLNHTMLLHVHKDRTDQIDIMNVATLLCRGWRHTVVRSFVCLFVWHSVCDISFAAHVES